MAEANLSSNRVTLTAPYLNKGAPADDRERFGYEDQSVDPIGEAAEGAGTKRKVPPEVVRSAENVAAWQWAYIADRSNRFS